MKKVCSILIFWVVLLFLFAGCQAPRDPDVLYDDPVSVKQQGEISVAFSERYGFAFNWNAFKPCLGTINEHTILIIRSASFAFETYRNEVAGCDFIWGGRVYLYAYRDGEVCKLQEAYESGSLTREDIEQIRAKFIEIEENRLFYEQEWIEQQQEIYNNGRDPDVLYTQPPTEEMKENIRSAIWSEYRKMVRWGYVDPYYGMINNCSIVAVHPFGTPKPEPWHQKIAGYTFEWDSPIELYVYFYEPFTSETCTLQEAYELGLLTQTQIGEICIRHNQYRVSFPLLLEDWEETRKEG